MVSGKWNGLSKVEVVGLKNCLRGGLSGVSLMSGFDGKKRGMRQVGHMAPMSLIEYQVLLSLGAMRMGDGEEDWRVSRQWLVNRASVSFLSLDGSSPHFIVICGERSQRTSLIQPGSSICDTTGSLQCVLKKPSRLNILRQSQLIKSS